MTSLDRVLSGGGESVKSALVCVCFLAAPQPFCENDPQTFSALTKQKTWIKGVVPVVVVVTSSPTLAPNLPLYTPCC